LPSVPVRQVGRGSVRGSARCPEGQTVGRVATMSGDGRRTEGTVRWTLDPGQTPVVDVSLAPEPSARYPC
jgi:hypothetical protein